jgi:hypothetical protein
MHPVHWLGIFMAMASDPANNSSMLQFQFGLSFAIADQQDNHGGNLVVAAAPVRLISLAIAKIF